MNLLQFRIATIDDVPVLARMNHALIRDEGHRNTMSPAQLEVRMRDWLESDYHAVLALAEDVAAYALYRYDADYVYLRQLYVHPKYRRRGIGRNMLTWLQTNAMQNHQRIRIDVLVKNQAAIAFYQSLGFEDYSMTMEMELTRRGAKTELSSDKPE